MGRVLVYFGRFALIFVGYVCASLTASAFMHVAFLRPVSFGVADARPTADMLVFSFLYVALFASYYAFMFALPIILAAEAFGWRSWLFYALFGGAIALIIVVFTTQIPENADRPFDAIASTILLGGGVVGGLAYWLVAGRLAGKWRAKARRGVREA